LNDNPSSKLVYEAASVLLRSRRKSNRHDAKADPAEGDAQSSGLARLPAGLRRRHHAPPAGLVRIEQSSGFESFHVLMDPAVVPTESLCWNSDILRRVLAAAALPGVVGRLFGCIGRAGGFCLGARLVRRSQMRSYRTEPILQASASILALSIGTVPSRSSPTSRASSGTRRKAAWNFAVTS
jgi:hypothetical protein